MRCQWWYPYAADLRATCVETGSIHHWVRTVKPRTIICQLHEQFINQLIHHHWWLLINHNTSIATAKISQLHIKLDPPLYATRLSRTRHAARVSGYEFHTRGRIVSSSWFTMKGSPACESSLRNMTLHLTWETTISNMTLPHPQYFDYQPLSALSIINHG